MAERPVGSTAVPERRGRRRSRADARRSRVTFWLFPLGTYLLFAVALFHRALLSDHSAIGYGSDPYLFQWHLAWISHALSTGHNPLFSRYVATPNGGENLMYYTSLPLAGLLLWPVTALGGALLSYNLLMVLCVVLSGLTSFIMCTRFVEWRPAALVGGLVYAFSPYMAAQSFGHPHLTMAWFPPAVVIAADCIVRSDRSAASLGVRFGLLVTAQLLLGTEVLVTSVLLSALGVTIWLAWCRRDPVLAKVWKRGVTALAVASVTVVVAGCFPLYMLLFGHPRVGVKAPIQPTGVFLNDLAGFVVPGRVQLLSWRGSRSYTQRFSGNFVEATAYVGLPVLIVVGFFLWKRRSERTVRLSVIAAGICGLLSLGPRLHLGGKIIAASLRLPAAILSRIPVLWNILPSRLMLYGYLALGLALAAAVDRGSVHGRRSRLILVCLALAFAIPVSTPSLHEVTPATFRSVARRGGVALVTPGSSSEQQMYWQADTGFSVRLVGGLTFSARPPNPLLDTLALGDSSGRWHQPTSQEVQVLRASARSLGATVVLDVPDQHEGGRRSFLAAVFGQPAVGADGLAVWRVVRP